jgi:hypothetical protein
MTKTLEGRITNLEKQARPMGDHAPEVVALAGRVRIQLSFDDEGGGMVDPTDGRKLTADEQAAVRAVWDADPGPVRFRLYHADGTPA